MKFITIIAAAAALFNVALAAPVAGFFEFGKAEPMKPMEPIIAPAPKPAHVETPKPTGPPKVPIVKSESHGFGGKLNAGQDGNFDAFPLAKPHPLPAPAKEAISSNAIAAFNGEKVVLNPNRNEFTQNLGKVVHTGVVVGKPLAAAAVMNRVPASVKGKFDRVMGVKPPVQAPPTVINNHHFNTNNNHFNTIKTPGAPPAPRPQAPKPGQGGPGIFA